jgi:hypothetical protein
VDQKVLLFLVILALVGIAYYVRFKPHRSHAAATTATAEASPRTSKPPRNESCDYACVGNWTRCNTQCNVGDGACSHRCDQTKERCVAACR